MSEESSSGNKRIEEDIKKVSEKIRENTQRIIVRYRNSTHKTKAIAGVYLAGAAAFFFAEHYIAGHEILDEERKNRNKMRIYTAADERKIIATEIRKRTPRIFLESFFWPVLLVNSIVPAIIVLTSDDDTTTTQKNNPTVFMSNKTMFPVFVSER